MSNPCDDLELYMKLNKLELQFVLLKFKSIKKHQLTRIFSILVSHPLASSSFLWMKCIEHSLFKFTRRVAFLAHNLLSALCACSVCSFRWKDYNLFRQ